MMVAPILFGLLLNTGLAMFCVAAYVARRRTFPGARVLLATLGAIGVWCIAYGFELISTTLGASLWWWKFEEPALTSVPVLYFLLALEFSGIRTHTWQKAALFVIPLLTQVMLWTSAANHLYWKRIWLVQSLPVTIIGREYGPGFWLFIGYSYCIVALTVAVPLWRLVRRGPLERRQTILFIGAGMVPYVANILTVFDLTPLHYVDFTPFAFAFTGVCVTWILFRYRFQNLVPVAWETVVEGMTDSVIVLDTADRLIELNPAARQLLTRQGIQGMGRTAREAFAGRPELLEVLKTREAKPVDITFHQDGVERTFEVVLTPLRDRRGLVVGRLLDVRDVTARRQAARELEASKKAAEAGANAKARFLAIMSHEIRTPMNGILGMAGILLHSSLPPEQRDYAEAIHLSARSLLTILNDILDFSKIEAGKLDLQRVTFNLRSVLFDVVRLMEVSARQKGLVLKFRFPAEVPTGVWGDPTRLRQVVLNLVGNAIKFTRSGEVLVSAEAPEVSGADALFQIAVQDTGPGIPEEKLPVVFEEFSQLDGDPAAAQSGTGLGLAISRRLVETMGGRLLVRSQVGVGSKFTIELRLDLQTQPAAPEPPSRHPATVADADRGYQGRRILLAEDNRINQRVAVLMLEKLGCQVDVAENGLEAVHRASERQYDLILMDCQMPLMDGWQASMEIRRRGIAAPIVALTANVLDDAVKACLEAGMNGFIAKPVETRAWPEILSRWLPER